MERLIPTDRYRTPPGKAGFLSARLPSLAFHLRMLGIYWRCNRMAARGRYGGDEWARSSLQVLRALERSGVRFDIENADIPFRVGSPCVYVANHMSTLETFVLPCLLQPARDTTFIVKGSLTRFPVFGAVLRTRDPIRVGRKDPREDLVAVLEGGRERLERGISIIVFPQTTRRSTFDPGQFNTIGVKLARRAGVPVVPVALKTDAWGVGRPVKDFGPILPDRTVHFCFGEPIAVEGSGREEHQRVVRFIQGKLENWEKQSLDSRL